MGRPLLERIKTCLIAILVLSGLVQIGILWDHQNHGLPSLFSLLIPWANPNSPGNSVEIKDVLSPYRVILSSGDGSYWQFSQDEEFYSELWKDAQSSLKTVFSGEPQDVLNLDGWGNDPGKDKTSLIDRRSYVIQFTTEIPNRLAAKLFDIKTISQDAPSGFSKILVTPGSDTDSTGENTVYIYSKKDGIYKYVVKATEKGFNLDKYNSILEQILQDDSEKYHEYTAMREIDKNRKQYDCEPDVLIVNVPPYKYKYHQISVSVPDRITDKSYMFEELLKNEYGSFNIPSNDDPSYIIAKNLENQYKIYNNGIMEYRYLLGHDNSEKAGIVESFNNALEFINKGSRLLHNTRAEIYLKKIEPPSSSTNSSYKFTFDYRIANLPVFVEIKPQVAGKALTNAIVIEADSKRVLNCRWQLLNIETRHETQIFDCRLDQVAYSSKQSPFKDVKVYDMCSGYLIESTIEKKASLWPSWVVEKTDGSHFGLSLIWVK